MAQRAAQESEQGQLALEGAQSGGIEAELEDPGLAGLLVPRHPDLAEATLAQLALDDPARPARDLLPEPGAPPLHLALFQRVGPPRHRRVRRRRQRGLSGDPHLADLLRLVGVGHQVPPVRPPAQLDRAVPARGRGLPHRFPRDVERDAGQQRLPGRGHASQPPAHVHRPADLELPRLVRPAETHDLPDMDAHPQPGGRALPAGAVQPLVQGQRGVHRGVGRREVRLVLAGRLRLEHTAPTLEHFLEQILERLDHLADPGLIAPPRAIAVEQLGPHEHDQLPGHPLRQRPRVEPHHPHLVGQVRERVERHPDAVGGGDPLDVLQLQPAQLLRLVRRPVERAVVGGHEDEHRLAQLDGRLVLELGVRPPRPIRSPFVRLAAIAASHQADGGVALADLLAEDLDHRAVIWPEMVLYDR